MRKSDENTADASLELLLDTICNSFGGILFLTILMALLLKVSAPKSELPLVDQAAQHELLQHETQLKEALATLDSLRDTLQVQGNTYDRLIDPNIAEKYQELREQEKRRDDLKREVFELGRTIATATVSLDQVTQQQQNTKAEGERLRSEVSSRRQELDDTIRRQTKTIHPSRTRSTSKTEFGLVVRYDRIYVLFNEDRGRLFRTLNHDDFLIVASKDGVDIATPKPYRGIPIEEGPQLRGTLAQLLGGRSPQTHYVVLAVWADSFDSFGPLRDALVAAGYEYRIVPFEPEDMLHFGPVDDPQVQ